MDEEQPQADVLAVTEARGITTILVINYFPTDPAGAGGYIYQRRAGTDERSTHVLSTNDTLRTLWASPDGHLWTSSTTGRVWTTANVPWTNVDASDGLDFEVPEGNLVWRYVALPKQERDGATPNTQEIWGTSDDNVFVGSFDGVVYRWDGRTWSQHDTGLGGAVGRFGGLRPDDVYACGYRSTILHFDGRHWRAVGDPDGAGTDDILTGIAFTDKGEALICGKSRGGRLLRGNGNGFAVVGRYGAPFIGMANMQGRLIFSAGKRGVLELKGQALVTLRDDLIAWSVAVGDGRLYFTETPPGQTVYSVLDLGSGTWRRLPF
jgi:hypothetical protein